MTIPQVTLGIDVSSSFLDAFDHPGGRSRRFCNDRHGIAALVGLARRLGAFIVLEATAPYDHGLIRAIEAAGLDFHRANPGRARDFARSIGLLAKTDRVDARMLAAYGAAVTLRSTAPVTPERLALQALIARRDQLVAMRKSERTRLKAALDPIVAESLKAVVATIDQEIRKFERHIETTVARSVELSRKEIILRSVSGIGPVTAGVLIAALPEIGQVDRRAIAALAGLAPVARDSGSLRGKRHVRGGRKRVRDALYMAALAAVRCQPFKQVYATMRDAGKPPKLALIAIARKLIVRLNSLVRDAINAPA